MMDYAEVVKGKIKKAIYILAKDKRVIRRQTKEKIQWIGTRYGGFGVCSSALKMNPTVYSFGIGEDVTFDLGMIKRYNAEVYAFDPTPKSIKWVKENVHNEKFHFFPIGISDKDQKEKFYLPQNENFVSGSMYQHKGLKKDFIEVEMYRLQTIMNKMGHKSLDLLKMDIEGSEFRVIPDILNLPGGGINQICVEIHGRFMGSDGYSKNRELIRSFNEHGYSLTYVSDSFEELTFICSDRQNKE